HVKRPLDVEAMTRAIKHFEGTHDFAAFAGQGMGVPGDAKGRPNTIRTVYLARLTRLDIRANFWTWDAPGPQVSEDSGDSKLLALDVVANAFLPQMIRTIVGTLLEVGHGKRPAESIADIIKSCDRNQAGPTAKPHGLCLLWV